MPMLRPAMVAMKTPKAVATDASDEASTKSDCRHFTDARS